MTIGELGEKRLLWDRPSLHNAGMGVFEVWLVKSNGQWARAGTISFFGADHHGTQTFDLNIAEAAARLGVLEAQAKALRMEVLPTTGLEAGGGRAVREKAASGALAPETYHCQGLQHKSRQSHYGGMSNYGDDHP